MQTDIILSIQNLSYALVYHGIPGDIEMVLSNDMYSRLEHYFRGREHYYTVYRPVDFESNIKSVDCSMNIIKINTAGGSVTFRRKEEQYYDDGNPF